MAANITRTSTLKYRLDRLKGLLYRHNISLSGTLDLRPAGLERRLESAQTCRGLLGDNFWGIEIMNYDLFDSVAPYLGIGQERCTLHFRRYFDGQGKGFKLNLSGDETRKVLLDASNTFFRFLESHSRFRNISLHLGYSCDKIADHPSFSHNVPVDKGSVLDRDETERRVTQTLLHFRALARLLDFNNPVIFEPLDYHPHVIEGKTVSAYEHITNPRFISKMSGRHDFGMLVDIAHTFISARNTGPKDPLQNHAVIDYMDDFLTENTIHKVYEVHLTVPGCIKRAFQDSHMPLSASRRMASKNKNNVQKLINGQILQLLDHLLWMRSASPREVPLLVINFEHDPKYWLKDIEYLAEILPPMLEPSHEMPGRQVMI